MSGICAVWRKHDPARLGQMLAAMNGGLALASAESRGEKTALEAGVGVSGVFETQQIYEDRRVLVACDADLYNEDELRASTGEKSAGTAALFAAAYHRFGGDFPKKLNGTFSVILWDKGERKLLAAVDRFGARRLVYFENGKVFLIASRIDALMRSGETGADVNPRAIANFLNFGVSLAPETIIAGVQRVAPGTLLTASAASTRVTPYWNMRYPADSRAGEERLSRELETLVEQAVARHCKGGSPAATGAYLSGGTDSSTVVGMMSRQDRGPVKAFSIGFQDERFNELGYAKITARKFKADHHTYLVSADDCLEALTRYV
jgi:asparagine synthase (glutamine-hydrolysing)